MATMSGNSAAAAAATVNRFLIGLISDTPVNWWTGEAPLRSYAVLPHNAPHNLRGESQYGPGVEFATTSPTAFLRRPQRLTARTFV
jgi:hypothetical protein